MRRSLAQATDSRRARCFRVGVVKITDFDSVRVLTMDRPDKLNALDETLTAGIRDALRSAAADDGVAVVVLTGEGRAFCAGVDLDYLAALGAGTADGTPAAECAEEIQEFAKPLIIAVNGIAVGMGTTMCLHADLVVAGTSARFRTPFTKLGVAPEIGSSWLLPQQIGYQRAAWMLLSSDWVEPTAALDYGLVFEVVADEDLLERSVALGSTIAAQDAESVVATKRTLRAWRGAPVRAAKEFEGIEFQALLSRR
jgi:enoyl-CoA hydratase/carnithine racemase